MRRQMSVAAALMLLLVAGCATKAHYRQVTVVIDRCCGLDPVKRIVNIHGYPTVLQVMKQAALIETIQSPTGGTWITSIDGNSNQMPNVEWTYRLNGVAGDRAPSEQIVGPGDVITWYAK